MVILHSPDLREKVLWVAAQKKTVLLEGSHLLLFPDLSCSALASKRELMANQRELLPMGLKASVGYPVRLTVEDLGLNISISRRWTLHGHSCIPCGLTMGDS